MFRDKTAFDHFTRGNFEMGAQVSAVAINLGASADANYDGGEDYSNDYSEPNGNSYGAPAGGENNGGNGLIDIRVAGVQEDNSYGDGDYNYNYDDDVQDQNTNGVNTPALVVESPSDSYGGPGRRR